MIPPHELKNREFTKVLRGYSSVEVDEHIEFIIEKYTEIYRENDELERKLKTALAEVDALRGDEESIRSALVNAQRASSNIIGEANERADLILRSAKNNCDKVIVDFKNKIKRERDTLYELRRTVEKFKAEIYEQYQQHITYLEEIAPKKDDSAEWEITDDDYVKDVVRKVKVDVAEGAEKISRKVYSEPEDEPVVPPVQAPDIKDIIAKAEAIDAELEAKAALAEPSEEEPEVPADDIAPETDEASEARPDEAVMFDAEPLFEEPADKPISVKDTIRELNKKFSIAEDDTSAENESDEDELFDFIDDSDDDTPTREFDITKK